MSISANWFGENLLYKVGHQSQQQSFCQSLVAILVPHACVNPKSLEQKSAHSSPSISMVFTVPVAFVNQSAILLLRIVKEQKYISHVLTTRHSIGRSFFF